jgi:hypothetical protein
LRKYKFGFHELKKVSLTDADGLESGVAEVAVEGERALARGH